MSLDNILMLAAFEISYLFTPEKGFAYFRLKNDATVNSSLLDWTNDKLFYFRSNVR